MCPCLWHSYKTCPWAPRSNEISLEELGEYLESEQESSLVGLGCGLLCTAVSKHGLGQTRDGSVGITRANVYWVFTECQELSASCVLHHLILTTSLE